jgi:hypothetical protein
MQALDKPPETLNKALARRQGIPHVRCPHRRGLLAMDLADCMKRYEDIGAGQRLIPNLPVCVRLDGKAFHRQQEKPWGRGARLSLHPSDVERVIEMVEALEALPHRRQLM